MSEACCADKACDGCKCKQPVRVITMDEARTTVGTLVLDLLKRTIDDSEGVAATLEGVEKENLERHILAARELGRSVAVAVKTFSTPRILRPQRSLKIAR